MLGPLHAVIPAAVRGPLQEIVQSLGGRLPRALGVLAVLGAPIAWLFRGLLWGRTYTETWYCAFDPLFAAARHFPTPHRFRDGVMDVSPSIIVRVSDFFASASWRRFELPLWDPHDALGTPLHAQLHQMVLAPLRVLLVFAPGAGDVAASVFCVVQILLGAVGVHLWLRSARVTTAPAIAAAVGYVMMGGVLWAFRFSDLPASMFAPWLFWRVERLLARPCLGNALGLGVAMALVAFSAHPVVAFLAILAGALYALVRFVQGVPGAMRQQTKRRALWLGVAGVHAAITAAGAWVPFLELSQHGWNYKSQNPVVIMVPGLFEMFFPWHGRNIVPAAFLPLAAAGLWFPSRVRVASIVLVVLGVLLTFNPGAPFDQLRTLSLFSFVLPSYSPFLVALGMGGLAAGLFDGNTGQAWRLALAVASTAAVAVVFANPSLVFQIPRPMDGRDDARTLAAFGGVAVVLVALVLRFARRPARWVAALALVALLGDSMHWAHKRLTSEPSFALETTPALAFLRAHTRHGERVVGVGMDSDPSPLLPNTAIAVGLDDIRGTAPLWVARSHLLLARVTGWRGYPTWMLYTAASPPGLGLGTTGLDVVGVRWIISRANVPPRPELRRAYVDQYVAIDENPHAFPRAFLVHAAVTAQSADDALRAMDRVSLRDVAVLERVVPRVGRTAPAAPAPGDSVRMRTHAARHVVLDVTAASPGYLVLSDSFYPGWRATVDGAPTPIVRANVAMRAVWVERGRHAVVFRYDPPRVLGALALTLLGLLAWAATMLVALARWAKPQDGSVRPLI